MATPIPHPPRIPFLGNTTTVETEVPIRSFRLLAQQYGEIYQLDIFGQQFIHLNTQALVDEVSDEQRFQKRVAGGLRQVRNLVGDALFTADLEEPNWGMAHRILMPAFGPANVRNMFDDMSDIASQLLLKWARFGPDHVFDPTDDYTRLTFDTIAICTMSHRLNSFYTEEPPKFTQAMVDFLVESGKRALRPTVVQSVMWGKTAKYDADIKLMTEFAQGLIEHRKEHPSEKKDLLLLMLEGRDPKTGGKLTEQSIIYNLLTFLIAGHETTSGMLSFTTYYLVKNPNAYRRLREEIDRVCGAEPVQLAHLANMPYLIAVMRESLRLSPTAPSRAVVPIEDTTIGGGKYFVKKGTTLVLHITEMHRDPAIWGDDADAFRPERMMDGKFEALPPHSWQPFGFGMRGCIGRPFAWQEAQLVIASVFQSFDLYLEDPSYDLHVKQSLTIKPKDLKMRAVSRPGKTIGGLTMKNDTAPKALSEAVQKEEGKKASGHPLYVLYGGNSGTCESFAQRLTSGAGEHGFSASLATLDSVVPNLPTDGPILIVTASYEGQPADNAAHFVDWLQNLATGDQLKGISYAVFGCGNREWAHTYQRIPTLCDEQLAAHGAERLAPRGEADVASVAFFQDFDEYEGKLWIVLGERFKVSRSQAGADDGFSVKIVDSGAERAILLRQTEGGIGTVTANRLLTKPGTPMKRHIEFSLPEGMTYSAGDYLAILPDNPPPTVQRAISRLGLRPDQDIVIESQSPTTFPTNKPISIQQLLSGYVELSQPLTTRDLHILAAATTSEATKTALLSLIESYQEEVATNRTSVLDVLEEYTDIDLPLATFLKMLPPMRVRQYSISSSPLVDPQHASLTVSILSSPARAGKHEQFLGVASNYLASLQVGDQVQMTVRASAAVFHPPKDPLVPVVMFCAGSGLAPFRGFIQERVAQKDSGRDSGKMLLFFGCRTPEDDFLYSDSDLKDWQEKGVVDVRPAFSRMSDASNGCKYVQDRIWCDRQDIIEAFRGGAKFFTCGSRKAANGIRQVCVDLINLDKSRSEEEAVAAFENVRKERYATDIFD
ncbi:cytochrome P450 oxidoreductase OrdA-like protein [Rickenella mellea]|uniref:Cytochrome P450 oxidoreductase OrdA-like protein n=1 Tax=Rickenella mellea TaxID=50990 RepID=A0A4Y7Q4U5_9AGAM|nr:cytochrome P450 oxidoreductase OrdA-like protein [Rickenella mellea]